MPLDFRNCDPVSVFARDIYEEKLDSDYANGLLSQKIKFW